MLGAIAFTIWFTLSLIGLIQFDRWLEKRIGEWAAWAFTLANAALWYFAWWGLQ